MKRLLLVILATISLPSTANAEIFFESHEKCLEGRDYAVWVKINKKQTFLRNKKIFGIGIRLFLKSDNSELIIKAIINDSTAAAANNKPNYVIIKIDGK